MSASAGWYPTPEGRLRYWDGRQWTEHFAPAPGLEQPARTTSSPSAPRPVGRAQRGVAWWLGWGGLLLLALLGMASSGVSGLFILAGMYVLVVAVVALFRGHVTWARIRTRATAGIVTGGAIVLTMVGGATATPTPSASSPTTSDSPSPSPSPTAPSATATRSTVVTPTPTPTLTPATSAAPSPATADEGTALAAVAGLLVKGRAPKSGYDREKFGQSWYDVDRNGCDTRNDILRRDLKGFTLKAGTNGCLVLSGTLVSPYTADTVKFTRGTATSSAVQIDHVVALSDAWQKGAQQLSTTTRRAFANDPLNLLAVDRSSNAAKGDGDTATWLPPNKAIRCDYVARQVAVKVKYRLWTTAAEREAMVRILTACPTRSLPVATAIPLGGGKVVTVAPKPKPKPTPTKTTSSLDPMFGTCGEANDAGYGPYVAGKNLEYDWYQDRDNDGIVCER